jgi:hypothetical protein
MYKRSLAIAVWAVSILGAGVPVFAEPAASGARQATVEQRSESVMPFDMNRTMHMFMPSASGGVQSVVSNDGDAHQIALIRSHLRTEARAFARGDYSDPGSIHGMTMPGLAKLHAGARHIVVRYADIANGAQITYATPEPALIAALHDWFAAQVSDHGAHAMMMGH